MFNFCLGFAAAIVVSILYPKPWVAINAAGTAAIAWVRSKLASLKGPAS